MLRLIAGLGNNGKNYINTFHNAGFRVVEYLKNNLGRPNIIFIKNKGCMNESGSSIKRILIEHRLKPKDALIIHDDNDINLGGYKFSFNRGSAGHKGVQSIIDELNTKSFWRLRIGIKQTIGDKKIKAERFVLKKMSEEEIGIIESILPEITKKLEDFDFKPG